MAGLGDEVLPIGTGQQHHLRHPGVVCIRGIELELVVDDRAHHILGHHLKEDYLTLGERKNYVNLLLVSQNENNSLNSSIDS